VGHEEAWRPLHAILEDEEASWSVKYPALHVACKIADEEMSEQIIEIVRAWGAAARRVLADVKSSRRGFTDDEGKLLSIVQGFVADSLPELQAKMADCRAAFDLSSDFVESHFLLAGPFPWWSVTLACRGSIEERRAFVMKMIQIDRGTMPRPGVTALVNETMRKDLRNLVTSENEPLEFHYMAAATLAHLGDTGILSHLKLIRPAFGKAGTPGSSLDRYIAQIELQNPPQRLLDYIASAPQPVKSWRAWAIRRAVELELPREAIRQAILVHATKAKPRRGRAGIEFWPDLMLLKRVGLELRVLRPGDLPRVRFWRPAKH